MQQKYETLANH